MASSQAFYDGLMSFESTSTGWSSVFCFLSFFFFFSIQAGASIQRFGGPLGGLVTVFMYVNLPYPWSPKRIRGCFMETKFSQ